MAASLRDRIEGVIRDAVDIAERQGFSVADAAAQDLENRITTQDPIGSVYVVHAVGTPRYKIGWSVDVDKRINSLKTGCPYPVYVVTSIPTCDEKLEQKLHNMYQSYRVHGEWFELPDRAVEFLSGADEMMISRADTANEMLKFNWAVIMDPSKVERFRHNMEIVLDGCGA